MTHGDLTGVRLTDFPDLGPIAEDTRLIAEQNGSGYHSIAALENYLRSRLAFDVSKFGAQGDGVTDDTAAIQAAIIAAGMAGADVQFDAKPYRITSALHVGNGSASGVSTYGGVRLIGRGQPLLPPQFMGGYPPSTARGTRLVWGGSASDHMLVINGPLQGWGVHNIFFDGAGGSEDFAGKCSMGLHIRSAMNGDCRNLTFRGCRDSSIYSTTEPHPPGINVADSLHNSFENIHIATAWANGVKGIVLTGVSPAGANTSYAFFKNVAITLPTDAGVAPTAYGVYFQSCDSNIIDGLHLFNGHPGCIGVYFDYTINDDWPAGNVIRSYDPGTLLSPAQNAGAPSIDARPNFIYSFLETNGGALQAGTRNLTVDGAVVATYHRVDNIAALPVGPLFYNYRTGLYRLNYNLIVTGGNATGGNLALVVNWLDGIGSPSFATPPVPNGPGNHQTGGLVMRMARFSELNFQVQLTGIGGSVTTQYSLMLALERLL